MLNILFEDDVRSLLEQTFLRKQKNCLNRLKGLLKQWFDQRGNRSLLLQLQRNAHSFEGGHAWLEMDAIHCLPSGKCI